MPRYQTLCLLWRRTNLPMPIPMRMPIHYAHISSGRRESWCHPCPMKPLQPCVLTTYLEKPWTHHPSNRCDAIAVCWLSSGIAT